MSLQSILFPIDKFTLQTAKHWLLRNKYKTQFYDIVTGRIDKKNSPRITQRYYRYRQLEPKSNKKYRTITLDKIKGIKAIVEYSKKE